MGPASPNLRPAKGTNINLAAVSNFLRKRSPKGGLARRPALLSSGCNEERWSCAERHLTRNKKTLMTTASAGSVPEVVWLARRVRECIVELKRTFQLGDMEL